MIPPGVKPEYDANPPWIQALLVAYDQIRGLEQAEQDMAPIEALVKIIARR